jgi:periplasmic protein TonB
MSALKTIVVFLAACAAFAYAQNAPPNSPSAPPPKARVSTGVMLGLVERKSMPVYPEEAMAKGIQGDVIFKLEVDETGKLVSAVPGDADPLLLAAAKDSLQTFRFRPYVLNGTPVRVESQIGFHFQVERTADGSSGHVECLSHIPNRP